jgi:hypothetical protein
MGGEKRGDGEEEAERSTKQEDVADELNWAGQSLSGPTA